MRIALGIEYDGAAFCGWQSQPQGCAVQDALEAALAAIAGEPVRVHVAGRTDRGVHATAQIAHFDTSATRPDSAWVRGVNAFVSNAIRVRWASRVADSFHARFTARARHYRYLLYNSPVAPAIGRDQLGWFHAPLELSPMREAADYLLGEHDFSAFRAAECQSRTPIKTLTRLTIERRSNILIFDFSANAFLQHMVRNIVGALVYVGCGRHEPAWIETLLESRDRRLAAPTFGAAGLYLVGVDYPAEFALPKTSESTPQSLFAALEV